MKKIAILLTGLVAVGALAGCNKEDEKKKTTYPVPFEVTGGTAEEQEALLRGINYGAVSSIKGNVTMPGQSFTLDEDDGDSIKISKKVNTIINAKPYLVNINWACEEDSQYFGKRSVSDEYQDFLEIEYQGYGKPQGSFSWWITTATCGGASANLADIFKLTAKVNGEQFLHEDKKISELMAVTDSIKSVEVDNASSHKDVYKYASTFNLVDYDYDSTKKYSPYFKTNNPDAEDKNYYYVNVVCEVVYCSPDGNWGIVRDGDDYLEIYAGAGSKLLTSNWPNLAKQYVVISGNVSQYLGNVQLGFITKIKEATAEQKAYLQGRGAAPAAYNFTESKISELYATIDGKRVQKQAIAKLPNAIGKVTGTYVAGTLQTGAEAKPNDSKKVTDISKLNNERFSFQMQVGSEKLTVAYDYHVDDGNSNVYKALKSKLQSGAAFTVQGTLRFNGNDTSPFTSLAYKEVVVKEADFSKSTYYTYNGGTFEVATEYAAGTTYYSFVDLNEGATWTIVPFLDSDVA